MIKNTPQIVLLYILAGCLTIYTLAGFFLAPWAAKKILVSQLTTTLERPVQIDKVSVNPYSLTAELNGFSIKNRGGSAFISIQSLFMNCSITSLFKLAPVVTRLKLDSPTVNLVLNQDKTFNFSDLLTLSENETPENSKKRNNEIFEFRISHVEILNGRVNFSDKIREANHTLEKFNLNLAILTSLKGERQTKSNGDTDFILNKSQIKIGFDTRPFTQERQTRLTLQTDPIDLMHYKAYLPLPKNLLLNSGKSSFDIDLAYSHSQGKTDLILNGKADLSSIKITDINQSPVLSIPQLDITFSPSNLMDQRIGLASIKISSPKIHLERDDQGKLNLLSYMPTPSKKEPQTGTIEPNTVKTKNQLLFSLDKGEIDNASIFFKDQANPLPFETTLSPVSIKTKNLLYQTGKVSGEYLVSIKTEAGESLASNGKFSTAPMTMEGNLTFDKVDLPKYSPYYNALLNWEIKKGRVHGTLDVSVSEKENNLVALLTNKQLSLTQFELWDPDQKESPVNLPELTVLDSRINTEKKRIDLGQIQGTKGKLIIRRQQPNTVNLMKSIPHVKPVKGDSPWEISLDQMNLEKFEVAFSDTTPKNPVSLNLSDISIETHNLKTWGKENADLNIKMLWNKEGKVEIKGQAAPQLMTADLNIGLKKLDIQSLQPYFEDKLKIVVTNGFFYVKGQTHLSHDKKTGPNAKFKGEAGISNFQSLYKDASTEFLAFNTLYLNDAAVSVFPTKVDIKEVALSEFEYKMTFTDEGFNTLITVINSEDSPGTTEDKTTQPDIHIGKVTYQGGNINFTDHRTQPNFTANMRQINGHASNISSTSPDPSQFYLQGIHGSSAPLVIQGRSKPLSEKPFHEMDISFKNIELVKFSSYAAKYLGQNIEKGKLVLDLHYLIQGDQLESKNRMFFDQLVLGEKVDSEDATSLPINLAISLLKNSDGDIDLNVPVNGHLNDPEFSFSSQFFEVFGNLITKIVTAPFKFLGSLMDGGEDLGYVSFEHGSGTIPVTQMDKIDQLVEILSKKETLKLEIEGSYDRLRDGDALRTAQFNHLLKLEKLKQKDSKTDLTHITLEPQEKEGLISKTYDKAQFPKPLSDDGKEKELSIEEKEQLLITSITVSELDLKELAMVRAENIKSYLLGTDKMSPERIFLRDPNPEVKETQSEVETNRYSKVLFRLKE